MNFIEKATQLLIDYSTKNLTDKAGCHSYEYYYPKILSQFENTNNFNMMEIGIYKGGSVATWAELFPKGRIYGVDRDINRLEMDLDTYGNITLLKGSQNDANTFKTIKDIKFNVIIDDCSHQVNDQISSFNILKNNISPGGIYIIEDIYPHNIYPHDFKKLFDVVDLTHIKGRGDDVLFVYKNNI